jgi:hypothetical protein
MIAGAATPIGGSTENDWQIVALDLARTPLEAKTASFMSLRIPVMIL